MSLDSTSPSGDGRIAPSEPNWDSLEMTDLFLDDSLPLAHVELVNDPNAIVRVLNHDLLTELLCEV